MAVHSPTRKLTYQDFEKIPEDRLRHEILDGVHVVTPAPTIRHQSVVLRLGGEMDRFVRAARLGRVFVAPLDVLLSPHDILEPDVLFLSSGRLGLLTERNLEGAPDLVVEVLSPSTRRRDLGRKLARYERLGVEEYWVLDPDRQTSRVYRRDGHASEAFLPPRLLAAEAGESLSTPLLPGFALPLREVFEE